MASKLITLQALLVQELHNLYSAEAQLIKVLPKIAQTASSENLKHTFENMWAQTKNHAQRLIRVTDCLEESASGTNCKAIESLIAAMETMESLIAESSEFIEEDCDNIVKDAGLICAAQKVVYYKIAGYDSAITIAEGLGLNEILQLLQQTLKEERSAVQVLTEIARSISQPNGTIAQ